MTCSKICRCVQHYIFLWTVVDFIIAYVLIVYILKFANLLSFIIIIRLRFEVNKYIN